MSSGVRVSLLWHSRRAQEQALTPALTSLLLSVVAVFLGVGCGFLSFPKLDNFENISANS